MIYGGTYESPLGRLRLTEYENRLTALWIDGQKAGMNAASLVPEEERPVFKLARHWLDAYFKGENPPRADLPLAPSGSLFQEEVWELLQTIPYGTTRTYGDIAAELARKRNLPRMAAQAVGGAVGRNPIAIIIPCHRVVGAKGNLTGYGGGLNHKKTLLELEGVDISGLSMPKQRGPAAW